MRADRLPVLPIGTTVRVSSRPYSLPECQIIGVRELSTTIMYQLGYIRRHRGIKTVENLNALVSPKSIIEVLRFPE